MVRDDANIKTVRENRSKTQETLQLQHLRESEEKYRTLFETMVLGVVYQDINGKIISANPQTEEILGLSIDQMQGKTSTDPTWKSIHEDGSDFPGETHPAMVALKTGKKVKNVIMGVFDPKKEETRWININATPLFKNDEAKPFQVYTTFEDITERQKAQENYKHLLNYAPTAIYEIDFKGPSFKSVNEALINLSGYSREELISMNPIDILDPESKKLFQDRIIKGLSGEEIENEVEYVVMHKDGRKLWVILNIKPVYKAGKIVGALVVGHDITKRKQDEQLKQKLLEKEQQLTEELTSSNEELQSTSEELHKSNEELQQYSEMLSTIYELNPDAIVLTTLSDSEIIDCNQEYLNQIGYSREETIGHTSVELNLITSEERNAYIDVTRDKKSVSNYELRVRRKDGLFIDVQYSARYITVNNEPMILNIGHDITERKLKDKELKDTMNELIRSNMELERFAYVSSHDLQEPLRMVTLYSQLLEKRYKDSLDPDADDFIEYIVENAKRMKQLIDDLLEYSRVTSQAKEFENVDLEKVLDVVLTNLSVSIAENNIKVTKKSLPTVFADKNQMMQVFQNLITNAIKFRGEKPPEIDISTQKGENKWKFLITDNGIGIKPEHQKQIFEVFKRLHTREAYPGTGIGLSICQKIIKHHEGRIWVESEPGKGSTFYFTIPIIKDTNIRFK